MCRAAKVTGSDEYGGGDMRQIIAILIMGAIAMLMAACSGTGQVRPATNSQAAAAFGNISLPHGYITHVMLYKVGVVYVTPFKSPPKGHTFTNGDFFFENLKPGKYFLVGFMSKQNAFYFNYRGIDKDKFIKEMAVDIKPGSITYLGSYKVTGINRNFIKSNTFDIKQSNTPSKSTVLKNLRVEIAGTGWDKRIARVISD